MMPPDRLGTSQRPPQESSEISVSSKETLVIIALLCAVLMIVYGNVFFLGRSLVYSDNYNPLAGYTAESTGPDFVPTTVWTERNLKFRANFNDPTASQTQWEPTAEFLRKGLARGEWPLWDPYTGIGAPAMLNMTSTYFFPPYFLTVLSGNSSWQRNIYFLILLLASGVFTYLFLRKHEVSVEASFFGALVFMLSGSMNQNIGSFMGQTVACLPFVLYMTKRFLDRPTYGRTAALSVSYAAVSLSSFPPMLIALFAFSTLYAVWTILGIGRTVHRRRLQMSGRFSLAAGLALGLVGFYYVPILDLLMNLPPHVAALYENAGVGLLSPLSLLSIVSPTLLDGTKVFADPPMQGILDIWEVLPYTGMVPLLAALLAWRGTPRAKRVLFMVTVATVVLVTLKLLGIRPVEWLALLPGLSNIHPHYFAILYNMAFAILGALGLDRFRAGRGRLGVAWLVLVVGLSVVVSLRIIAKTHGALEHPHSADWMAEWTLVSGGMVAFAALLFLGTATRWGRAKTRWLTVAVIGVFLLEGVSYNAYPRQKAWDVWQNPVSYVEKMKQEVGEGRVFTALGALHPNAASAFEHFNIESMYAFNSSRVFQLFQRYAKTAYWPFMYHADVLPPEGVLDRANVEHLIVRKSDPGREIIQMAEERGYEEGVQDDYAWFYRRRSSPRYYFSSSYRVMSPEAALEEIGSLPAGREVVLEQQPSFRSHPNRQDDPTVEVLLFTRNGYRLLVETPRAGLLYCSESFFRGWTARVNGQRTEILGANYAFRAVEVPQGRTIVEFSYRPPGLQAGLIISLLSAVLLLVGAFWGRRRDSVGGDNAEAS